jgi:DNA-binding FrmR family transcriptional regulator
MATLTDASARADILSRLKRAEGQLRGIQRMVEEGVGCLEALDSAYVRLTMCLLEQEFEAHLQNRGKPEADIGPLMADVQKLLTRM